MQPLTPNNPSNVALLVGSNEVHKLILVCDHKHLLHIIQSDTFVATFCRSSNLVPDCINEFFDEEVIGCKGNVLLLRQDLLVRSLNKVCLERDRNLDVNVLLKLRLRDQLNLGVVL